MARQRVLLTRYLASPTNWWVVAGPEQLATVRHAIAVAGIARLEPRVFTTRHLATHLAKEHLASRFEVSRPVLFELLSELVASASHRASGAIRDFVGSPSAEGFLADSFRRLRLAGLGAPEAASALRAANGDEAGGLLARLYTDYVSALERHRLIDDAAVIEAAIEAVDGMADYRTLIIDLPGPQPPLEERLLQRLGELAGEVVVVSPGHPERFEAAQRFCQGWQAALGVEGHHEQAAADEDEIASELRHIESHLFRDDTPTAPAGEGFRVIAARDSHSVARDLARRVKALLVAGESPQDLLVALPHLDADSGRYASALTEVGVPHRVRTRPAAGVAPRTGALLDLLKVANSDWSFDPLIALLRRRDLMALRSGESTPGFANRVAAAEWFVRSLQVPSGRRYLERQAESLSQSGSTEDRLTVAATAAVSVFAAIGHALDAAPGQAPPLAWEDAADEMLRRLGYASTDAQVADAAAQESFERAASSLEGLARLRGRRVPDWSISDYTARVRAWSRLLRLSNRESSESVVRVVDLRTALSLSCKHLLVGDAGETAFSPSESETGSDAAMLRFFQLVNVPTRSLAFVYAENDEAGQPLLPSPYVAEARRLFGDRATRTPELLEPSEPASLRDLRHAAVRAACRGEGHLLSELTSRGSRSLLHGVRAVSQRVTGEVFGPCEGVLHDRAASNELRDRYGPRRLWSATQLETLAACPFKFFASDVLELRAPGEMAVSVDHRRRGSLMHDALAEASLAAKSPRVSEDDPSLADWIRQRVDPSRYPPHESTLAEIEARQAIVWADDYPRQQSRYAGADCFSDLNGSLGVEAAEFRFGPRTGEGVEDPASTDRCLELELPSGEVLQVVGRIDRVDTLRDDGRVYFTVIDYKTARDYSVKLNAVREGRQLQPVLYALAAQRLLLSEGAIPVAAGYWVVRKDGFVAPKPKELPMLEFIDGEPRPSQAWRELVADVTQITEDLVQAVRRGEFPMDHPDEDCGRTCDFSTICRVGQARSLGRVRPGGADSQ